MALRVRIVAVIFILCTISPLLASAYSNVQGKEPTRDANARAEDDFAQETGVKHKNDKPAEEATDVDFPRQGGYAQDENQKNGQDHYEGIENLNPFYNGGGEEQGQEQPALKLVEEPIQEAETPVGLKFNFYQKSCPAAAGIIKKVLQDVSGQDAGIRASLVRLYSHDCFVQGCDASILLDQNPNGEPTEKTAGANGQFIRGTEIIDQMKAEIEKACPGVVSCADILTLATRDALVASGIPNFEIPLGRRDGLTSIKNKAEHDLPIPTDNVNNMIELFKRKGLNEEDLATLIGAHSIGEAHCASFGYRTQNPEKIKEMNPKTPLDINHMCWNNMATLPIDSASHFQMDSLYYKGLMDKTGILESDQMIALDPRTTNYVQQYAQDQNGWHQKFTASLIKMSKIEVLTGNAGQIRKQCRFVN
ncbi:hypothetical protein Leryth_008060 [Lithospermum erythrorhizon]|uniref:Peroxidase n=1 Tax=Lithospermum erythrorhizon TaxID=34254 RepID=A0AAV3QXZ5_LITER|nr:hypothetical protein Leryth_008060 [Lithospermum erythrorhizon]